MELNAIPFVALVALLSLFSLEPVPFSVFPEVSWEFWECILLVYIFMFLVHLKLYGQYRVGFLFVFGFITGYFVTNLLKKDNSC